MKKGKRRKREKRKGIFESRLAKGIVAFTLLLVLYLAVRSFLFPRPPPVEAPPTIPSRAAIVDHLSISHPNQTFIEKSTAILRTAGFSVDYYGGEEVGVEFFRNLPAKGYGFIVLRLHSAVRYETGSVVFFTSEPHTTSKYVYEQLTELIGSVSIFRGGPRYFGVSSEFMGSSTNGRFENTIVVMMGCDGLTYPSMAEALVERGARVYVSWDGPVSASHTDHATTSLLQHLIVEKQTIREATAQTMREVGPDPDHESVLLFYPAGSGDYVVPNFAVQAKQLGDFDNIVLSPVGSFLCVSCICDPEIAKLTIHNIAVRRHNFVVKAKCLTRRKTLSLAF